MSRPSLERRALKLRAKQTLARFARPCMAASGFLLLFTLLAQLFSVYSGGALYYLMLDVKEFPMETGVWKADPSIMATFMSMVERNEALASLGGLVFSLRDDMSGTVFVLPLAWRQLANLLIIQVIVFLATVPLQYGVLEQFRNVLDGHPVPFRRVLHWYLDLRLTVKALLTQLVLVVWEWGSRLLALVPAGLCLVLAIFLPSDGGLLGGLLLPLYLILALGGGLLGYYLYTLLLPARYLLAQSPQLSIGQALSQGLALSRGRRKEYFLLNLSFLPWHIAGLLLWNVPTLYLQPYLALSNYLFLTPPAQEEGPVAV